MTPEHLSRVPHDLAAQGLIEADDRIVRVSDLDRLRGAT